MNEKKSAAAVSFAPLSPTSDPATVTEALRLYRKMNPEQQAAYIHRLRKVVRGKSGR